ncbi:protein PHYLLO, chloroplastic isoform X13 [Durio zibethinus]|uniref:Protein PHYLLO, chloroplastic isoform X13 n=1 Tax=Durio zibethinus TaxID=66656 RepID=A0A6P6BHV7_DURZI|nr:protein PHYLLO, chloroplastic isoform X13 [Durio zibethinus]
MLLLRDNLSIPFLVLKPKSHLKNHVFHAKKETQFPRLPLFRKKDFLSCNLKMVNGVRFDVPVMDANELEDGDLMMETCITRTLPPALTLEHGLQGIKEVVEELKLNPPCSSSGVLRFQVAVPPSAKALNWFCSQPESSGVFPLFFLSKEMNSPTCKSLYLNTARGVFGIGAAVSFTNSSCVPGELGSIKRLRCLSNDSILMSTYGFVDINFNTELSSVKHMAGSFYFFIPLIELDEHDDISILAATLAWSDSCLCTFEQAIHSYESALYQASSHFWPATERCHSEGIRAAIRKLNVVEDKTVQMVYMNAISLSGRDFGTYPMELKGASSFRQFCCKFSPTVGVACNMLDCVSEMTYCIQDHANINVVWASIIIEECSRLGLTYFCIAPGSRSSPLALAASRHPLVTCISCFDERSLAFHAVGYARGSQKAAAIITTSGTAVSNLLPAVVEASQDFVPLLVLSADRPPELLDCGANQSINQVGQEISFQVCAEHRLSEPYIAHVISKALSAESALFIGNSMVIRDADMYGYNWTSENRGVADMVLKTELPCKWISVAGNRGASGIDGLLSTAIGFAVGCNKRVLCVVGDISFLHDTNGLAILKQRMLRKPMTILVINNHGGAIFSLLPVADKTEPRVLNQYFYTSHNISVHKLCEAHGVKHLEVKTKMELHDALLLSQQGETDYVIEVESSIDANATFHSYLRKFACQAADHALGIVSKLSVPESTSQGCFHCKVHSMSYSLYRISLCAPPTSSMFDHGCTRFYREGFILSLTLEDGHIGYGEVAPLEICHENLLDVEEQLRFLFHVMKGASLNYFLPMLKSSFSFWIWKNLGIPACSLFPSVRCGLEMAILNAIAVSQGSSLLNILHPHREREKEKSERLSSIRICALIDSSGTPEEVACIAVGLVEEGFTAIKIKVARRADPVEDAAVIQEVRKKVGCCIELRVDANRNWTYEQAIQFGFLVKDCDLQYIEEPVQDEDDIIRYCEESGLPVALDETIDNCPENPLNMLVKYSHPRIVALVIKPTAIGGFEKAAMIARWAQRQGKMAIVSAAFESSLALSTYIQFSCYLEMQNADTCKLMNNKLAPSVAHGLGTYRWLEEDVTTDVLGIGCNSFTGFIEASVAGATHLLHKFQMNHNVIHRMFTGEEVLRYQLTLDSNDLSFSINVLEIGQRIEGSLIVFLHGFLGTNEEWVPIMHAISGSARCISVDLPGHGVTKIKNHGDDKDAQPPTLSIEIVADLLSKLIEHITPGKVTLVGYSMGARIALYMALMFSDKIEGAVILSGNPGLEDTVARKIRRAKDDSRARSLVTHGLELFLNTWYSGGLWMSLRSHPYFNQTVARRSLHDDVRGLARVLSDLSTGRQPSLWEDLKHCKRPLMLIVGEKDEKFKKVAQKMWHKIGHGSIDRDDPVSKLHEMVVVPNCGHAVHLENPLSIIRLVRQFLTRLKNAQFQ